MRSLNSHHAPHLFGTLAITAAGTYALSDGTTATLAKGISGTETLTSAGTAHVTIMGGGGNAFSSDNVVLDLSHTTGSLSTVEILNNDTVYAGSGIFDTELSGKNSSFTGTFYTGSTINDVGQGDNVVMSVGGGGGNYFSQTFGMGDTLADTVTASSNNNHLSFQDNSTTTGLYGCVADLFGTGEQITGTVGNILINDFSTSSGDTFHLGTNGAVLSEVDDHADGYSLVEVGVNGSDTGVYKFVGTYTNLTAYFTH
jgi:hypothetical protein